MTKGLGQRVVDAFDGPTRTRRGTGGGGGPTAEVNTRYVRLLYAGDSVNEELIKRSRRRTEETR
jgi:hypothetical protein